MSLRERNRHNTLVVTQRTAVELFSARGFEDVKVADIAEAVGMAPSTLYRHFPTKESILLWDEHAETYAAALSDALSRLAPFEALREAFVAMVAGRYDDDAEFQLRRVTLLYATPSAYAAAAEADLSDRRHLIEMLTPHLSEAHRPSAALLARSALMAVDWAFDEWQAGRASTPLVVLVETAFDRIGHLAAIT